MRTLCLEKHYLNIQTTFELRGISTEGLRYYLDDGTEAELSPSKDEDDEDERNPSEAGKVVLECLY